MPKPADINVTTGAATLPGTGVLSYNGCTFSSLFYTNVSGKCIKDDAQRTVKFMEYTITVDGYVTLPSGAGTIAPTMDTLKTLLTAQGGALRYTGRGNDIIVNVPGGKSKDAAWGPVPELLEYEPMGGNKSAKVKWTVRVHVVEFGSSALTGGGPGTTGGGGPGGGNSGGGGPGKGPGGGGPPPFPGLIASPNFTPGPSRGFQPQSAKGYSGGRVVNVAGAGDETQDIPRLLQFNYESSVSYGEDYFSTLSVKGVLEIPLTRIPTQPTRTFSQTADLLRGEIERRVMSGIDLKRFRIVKRDFALSRDKRTLSWDFQAEEKPYMDLPYACPIARGSFSVRPAKAGMGLCTWMCTLRCTYIVKIGTPRRVAFLNFLELLRQRMAESRFANNVTNLDDKKPNLTKDIVSPGIDAAVDKIADFFGKKLKITEKKVVKSQNAWVMDFNIDEGVYLDSKTITFSTTWKLSTTFSHILLSSGVWKKVDEGKGKSLWAISIKDVSGAQSWLSNKMLPDIIVDFGGGDAAKQVFGGG